MVLEETYTEILEGTYKVYSSAFLKAAYLDFQSSAH